MSTTVSYKGNTLTTVNNETKTLNTSGKWLEDNITLVDVTSGGGGGWLPSSAVLVASADETINLSADTSWDSWTPTTTSTTILAAGTTRGACSYNVASEYATKALIGFCLMYTDLKYVGNTYAKGYLLNKVITSISYYAPMEQPGYNSLYYGKIKDASSCCQSYYSSDTSVKVYAGFTYGVGCTSTNWSISNATSTTSRIVGYTRQKVYAQCNTSYFTTAAAAAVDSANSNIYCKYRIYTVDKTESPFYAMFDASNGLLFQ